MAIIYSNYSFKFSFNVVTDISIIRILNDVRKFLVRNQWRKHKYRPVVGNYWNNFKMCGDVTREQNLSTACFRLSTHMCHNLWPLSLSFVCALRLLSRLAEFGVHIGNEWMNLTSCLMTLLLYRKSELSIF